MIEHLASLPPVQGALDQILHRFGTEIGRRGHRPLAAHRAPQARRRPALRREPPGSANFAETAAFMDDEKRILVFSDAGGTGRSYHADLGCRNQRQRVHYLLEPGWKADAAIQGLGPLEPHQPEAAAGVPSRRHRRQGREALPLDHRAASRHARRDHPRPAPDRRPGPVPRRRQSRKPLCQGGAAAVLPAALRRQGRRLLARRRSRTRPASTSPTRTARCARNCRRSRSSSTACWPCDRAAEHALCGLRGVARRAQSKAAIAARHLRSRRRDADRRELRASPNAARSIPMPPPAPRRAPHPSLRADRNRPLPLADALALAADHAAPGCWSTSSRTAPRCRCRPPSLMHDDGADRAPRAPRSGRWRASSITLRRRSTLALARGQPERLRRRCGKRNARRFRNSPTSELPHRHRPACCRSGTGCRRDNIRVYRFETDDGERVIGRLVTPEALARALCTASALTEAPALSADEAWNAVLERGAVPRSRRRAAIAPLPGHGRAPRRTDRLQRRHGRPAQGARPDLGDHLLAAAPLRAGRRQTVARRSSPHCSNAIRSCAPTPRRGLIRRCPVVSASESGAPPRARRRGGVPLTISRTGAVRAVTGPSATSRTRRDAAFMSGSTAPIAAPAPPGNGPTPRAVSMAISSI